MLKEEQVKAIIAEVVGNIDVANLSADTDFDDAGLDSLDQASLLLAIKERYGIDFPDEIGAEMNSIRAILDYAATVQDRG